MRTLLIVAVLLALAACRPNPHAPLGPAGNGIPGTTEGAPPAPAPTPPGR